MAQIETIRDELKKDYEDKIAALLAENRRLDSYNEKLVVDVENHEQTIAAGEAEINRLKGEI